MATKHDSVKFTAEEMAYDPPDTTDPKRWIGVGRGPAAIFAKPSKPALAAASKTKKVKRQDNGHSVRRKAS